MKVLKICTDSSHGLTATADHEHTHWG